MTKKTKIVLSLGRLHPLKGLDLLISAFAEIKRTSSWQLIIAGPDEQGTKEKLKIQSEKLKIRIAEASDLSDASDADIIFMGSVQGEAKWDLIKRADIFVLPSRSENFGIVVGEALSCGVPVVTTAVGPWLEAAVGSSSRQLQKGENIEHPAEEREVLKLTEELPTANCQLPTAHRGLIVVETSVEGIVEGLERMMALSDDERHEMGRKGSEWVKREFSWDHVAKQMVEAYEEGRAAARPCRGGINEPRGLSVGRGEL